MELRQFSTNASKWNCIFQSNFCHEALQLSEPMNLSSILQKHSTEWTSYYYSSASAQNHIALFQIKKAEYLLHSFKKVSSIYSHLSDVYVIFIRGSELHSCHTDTLNSREQYRFCYCLAKLIIAQTVYPPAVETWVIFHAGHLRKVCANESRHYISNVSCISLNTFNGSHATWD